MTRVKPVSDRPPKPLGRPRRDTDLLGLPDTRRIASPKELVLHMGVAKLLRDHCLPEWRWTHMPSGERRDIRTASKLKQMGTQPGWPDFLLLDERGVAHCLELKRAKAKLTIYQGEFMEWCMRSGIPYTIADSFTGVLNVLDSWGCLRVKLGGRYDAGREKPIRAA